MQHEQICTMHKSRIYISSVDLNSMYHVICFTHTCVESSGSKIPRGDRRAQEERLLRRIGREFTRSVTDLIDLIDLGPY